MSEEPAIYGREADALPHPGERYDAFSARTLDALARGGAGVRSVRPVEGLEIETASGERAVVYQGSDGAAVVVRHRPVPWVARP